MLPAATLSISIDRNWRDAYEAIWRPEAFATWAAGLARANLRREGDAWKADGVDGPIAIRFSDHNAFGVLDHWVDAAGDGAFAIYVPMRLFANGGGCEAAITVYRQPEMSDAILTRDLGLVRDDLATLKKTLER